MNFDILIKNGRVIDGAGNPWYRADVGIMDGKIAKIGRLKGSSAAKELDVSGKIVCPGFIDPHSHSDSSLFFDARFESTIRQGITTVAVGNCGESLAPLNPEKMDIFKKLIDMYTPPGVEFKPTWHYFEEYLEAVDQIPCSTNIVPLVGFAPVRISGGPGYEDREPTAAELESMKNYVKEAMEAGAFGFSTGLIYTPQYYAKTDEIIEVTKVISKYNGIYFSHIRGEGATVVDAVKEVIEIVEKTDCAGGQIAHHKVAGKPYWGASKETLRLIEDANARGLNITADQYPYNRGMTSFITVLPPWVHIGGVEKILERLQDPANQERIRKDVEQGIEGWENWIKDVGFGGIYIASVKTDKWKDIEGKSIAEIAQIKGNADEWQILFDLLLEEKAEVSITVESMGEEDIKHIMQGRYTMIGTDGSGVSPTGPLSHGKPHPRFYGTYPRVLGHYVREKGIMTLQEAIRKMTSFPAQKLRLWDRGLVREGMWADLVVFDPETVIDKATFTDPHRFPEGIHHVLVNGEVAVEDKQQTKNMPGTVLRRPA